MKTAKGNSLMAFLDCGCLSHALLLCEHTTAKDVGVFHGKAFSRKCRVQEIKPGDSIPEWECEAHRAERLARAELEPKIAELVWGEMS